MPAARGHAPPKRTLQDVPQCLAFVSLLDQVQNWDMAGIGKVYVRHVQLREPVRCPQDQQLQRCRLAGLGQCLDQCLTVMVGHLEDALAGCDTLRDVGELPLRP